MKPHHIILSAYDNIDRDFDEWFKTKINKFRKKRIITANHFYMKKNSKRNLKNSIVIFFIPVIWIQFRTKNDKYYTNWLVPHFFNCILARLLANFSIKH